MIVWPCAGPTRSACKIRRSSVPWRSSIRSLVPIDILGELSIDATPRMSRWTSNDQFGAAIGRTVDDVGGESGGGLQRRVRSGAKAESSSNQGCVENGVD